MLLPPFDEEYFEWIDLFEALSVAEKVFSMIELGAGYGKWIVRGAFASRHFGNLPCRLIGVEAEPTHFQWMQQHFKDNNLDLVGNELIQAAVTDRDGFVKFKIGNADNCYGQSIFSWRDRLRRIVQHSGITNYSNNVRRLIGAGSLSYNVMELRAVSLKSLLAPLSMIDLIDLDVQGSEFRVLNAAREELDAKVKRVHIGTHSHKLESELRSMFKQLRWTNRFDFPINTEKETDWGSVKFLDGVQTWINPSLTKA